MAWMREFTSLPFFLYLSKTPEKYNFSYLFLTARIVPIGKHIFSFGVISYVLSLVWYFINNEHAEDNIIIYLSKSGNNSEDNCLKVLKNLEDSWSGFPLGQLADSYFHTLMKPPV